MLDLVFIWFSAINSSVQRAYGDLGPCNPIGVKSMSVRSMSLRHALDSAKSKDASPYKHMLFMLLKLCFQ
jgi:hypothetical protein